MMTSRAFCGLIVVEVCHWQPGLDMMATGAACTCTPFQLLEKTILLATSHMSTRKRSIAQCGQRVVRQGEGEAPESLEWSEKVVWDHIEQKKIAGGGEGGIEQKEIRGCVG
jgi:hypothetical protein